MKIYELIDRVAAELPDDWKYRAPSVFYRRPSEDAVSPVKLSAHRYPSVADIAARVVREAGLEPAILDWQDMRD